MGSGSALPVLRQLRARAPAATRMIRGLLAWVIVLLLLLAVVGWLVLMASRGGVHVLPVRAHAAACGRTVSTRTRTERLYCWALKAALQQRRCEDGEGRR